MEHNFSLPDNLKRLADLATNFWFSWNPEVRDLFREIDLELWRKCERNPVHFLHGVEYAKLEKASKNQTFIEKLQTCWERFDNYIHTDTKNTRFNKNFPNMSNHLVAYFSAEYGLHESLQNYAGGLGILAGDHIKSASDLGIPFIAIGLMYKNAYFHQQIDQNGDQIEIYNKLEHDKLPIKLVKDEQGDPLLVCLPLINREIYLKIWEANVGRISIYFLDSTVDNNSEEDQNIIHILYGGTRDTRIQQEIILGIGGLRAIYKMGFIPTLFHINESHSAFLVLERLYQLMNEGIDFKSALEFVRATTIFTTHTPVPAGNEEYEFIMMEKYFAHFWPELEISHEKFFDLGRNINIHQQQNFSLTALALNLSNQSNGVSDLHGKVTRKMWQKTWPGVPTHEIPIGHITNGIHTSSWLHREMIHLFDNHFGPKWRNEISNQHFWDKIYEIPNEIVWLSKKKMKKNMTDHIRRYYRMRMERINGEEHGYPKPNEILKPEILTIGFARRFAPYKRALLLFKDLDRLKKIINNPDRPIQILFSGKSHPENDAGKMLIKKIDEISREEGFIGKIIFVENYNMNIARSLTSGVDLWLNTPRRPLEASGTSGQKVPINLGINFSVLDGWWFEGYNGQNGWAIGLSRKYDENEEQDQEDSESLYHLLENEIAPLYYERDENGIPNGWIEKMKHSFHSTIFKFSTHRMVWEYLQKYYIPAMKRYDKYTQEEYKGLFQFCKWKNRIERRWKDISMSLKHDQPWDVDKRILSAGESREIVILINSAGLKASDLLVEVIISREDAYYGHHHMKVFPMGLITENVNGKLEYRTSFTANKDGSYRFNCRILPTHPDLYNKYELRLIKWLD
jgi:starch phosphorylase